ncbi:hypothetical protein NEOLEDRAFT_371488 [Neolentinus lepideus HHB14362 ss-1]|uniref:Uncharacterized protein n=1 Tax=Neolentinus lepideus HHB14362 ss-1 TaxID=1314782 RepID=A0A165SHW1_9AGAM|nr:hypothetical protein NEOLEDRAFT_371488 [Neolentinus lepideus HHB14362 ss-1]
MPNVSSKSQTKKRLLNYHDQCPCYDATHLPPESILELVPFGVGSTCKLETSARSAGVSAVRYNLNSCCAGLTMTDCDFGAPRQNTNLRRTRSTSQQKRPRASVLLPLRPYLAVDHTTTTATKSQISFHPPSRAREHRSPEFSVIAHTLESASPFPLLIREPDPEVALEPSGLELTDPQQTVARTSTGMAASPLRPSLSARWSSSRRLHAASSSAILTPRKNTACRPLPYWTSQAAPSMNRC